MTDLSKRSLTRRDLLDRAGAGAVALGLGAGPVRAATDADDSPLKGNINHSVARWTYGFLDLPELCALCAEIGIPAIDLVGPDDWPVLKAHGLDSSMCNGAEISLTEGWADRARHAELSDRYLRHIELVAEAGYRNLICFSGNRAGMEPEAGLDAAAEGLAAILPMAEQAGVTLQMELLNSKVNHPDYLCDRTSWGLALWERLGSENFKLLYDIYHMQIMEGDVIRTITDHAAAFGHYHTAGNPGRHEPDDSQELNYPAIARAIRDTGFTGYLAQEFVPSGQGPAAADALRAAVAACDV